MKKYIFLIISLLLISGCSFKTYDEYELPEELSIELNENKFEVYNEVKVSDMIKSSNGKLLNDSTIVLEDTGKNKFTAELEFEDKTYKKDIEYEVIDVTPPVFISASSTRSVVVNEAIYPCNAVIFADDVDNVPNCEVVGEYDLTTVGNYKLKYVISDSSGNTNEKDFVLKVLSQPSKSSGTSTPRPKIYYNDFISRYKNDTNMVGIDVSKWQGDIDFNKVKEAGAEFVIMRIGVQSSPENEVSMDKYFEQNIKNAKAAGLKVGVYLYTSAIDTDTAREHAKWVIETLNGEKLDLPVAYDWENWSKFMSYEVNLHTFNNCFYTFRDTLKNAGYDVMLYGSKFYLENVWENKDNDPVWLAHYTSQTNYQGDYILWQRDDVGRIDGINGAVDLDIYYKK